MGLSGRKVKQRIGNDPRNLSWADDASRFGQAYLEKFGWDTSKGLGASGEGRTSAIKTSQKLDMLGIGMQRHQNDPNGIAWRQNRDFENLLQRLNEGTEAIGSFHKARGSSSSSKEEEVAAKVVDSALDADESPDADATKREKKKKKQKKRKVLQKEEEEEAEAARDKRERKKRKKSKSDIRRAASEDDASEAQAPAAPAPDPTPVVVVPAPVPTVPIAAPAPVRALPRAHRARFIAAKRMAASNSAALAEILGIPFSHLRLGLIGPPDEPVRAASMLAAMFARGQATAGAKEEADGASVERAEMHEGDAGDEEGRRRAKEERRKRKEERRRRKEEAKNRAIAEPDAKPQ
ncbi:hypothetical protein BJY52DRAFT_1241916 [Lactarius psammicola]|nr:hypothetical protein BJY52DRAFT_1241916 [Lactarius psammicola]